MTNINIFAEVPAYEDNRSYMLYLEKAYEYAHKKGTIVSLEFFDRCNGLDTKRYCRIIIITHVPSIHIGHHDGNEIREH